MLATAVAWFAAIAPAGGLDSPMGDRSDFLAYDFYIKTTLENGWYLDNPRLAAPDGGNYRDFPNVDAAHVAFFSALGLFTDDHILAFNLFYLLSFAATAASAFWALRRAALARPWACAGALLFALLPYHFLRAPHLFLAAYWSVPIFAVCALELTRRHPRLALGPRSERAARWAFIALVALAANGGIYYAFFGCLLIALGGISGAIRHSSMPHVARVAALCAIVVAVVAINLAPSIVYVAQQGINPSVAARIPVESEIYGLKLSQLLMPVQHHRLALFAAIADAYQQHAPLQNENASASLGLLGSVGFLTAIGGILLGVARRGSLMTRYGVFVLAAFLWASIGGFSVVFAFAVSPEIRASNRISPYIAFFSLAAAMWILQRASRAGRARAALPVRSGIAVCLVAAAIADQVPASVPDPAVAQRVAHERAFVQTLESRLPDGAAVYQLPSTGFPEATGRSGMGPYDHLIGYLYSKRLRFSAGAIRARPAAQWQDAVSTLPLRAQLAAISRAGFRAVWLDRDGYSDRGTSMARDLRSLLGAPLAASSDGRVLVFALTPSFPAPFDTVAIGLGPGWSDWLPDAARRPHAWSAETSELIVHNMTGAPVVASITCPLRAIADGRVTLRSAALGIDETIALEAGKDAAWSWRGNVPAGDSVISVDTDVRPRHPAIADPRRVSLTITRPSLTVLPGAAE